MHIYYLGLGKGKVRYYENIVPTRGYEHIREDEYMFNNMRCHLGMPVSDGLSFVFLLSDIKINKCDVISKLKQHILTLVEHNDTIEENIKILWREVEV